jgi:hypothetical protein
MVFCSCIGACSTVTPHENFKNIMQANVGRSSTDYYYTGNRLRDYTYVGSIQLANGNIEEGFKTGAGYRCRVYFEIDRQTRHVSAWRYEGTPRDCSIVP